MRRRVSNGLARQAQETAAQAEARAKQDIRKTSASLSAALARQQQDAEQARQQLNGQLTDLQQANTTAAAKIGEISGERERREERRRIHAVGARQNG